jgi:hypothetical protein
MLTLELGRKPWEIVLLGRGMRSKFEEILQANFIHCHQLLLVSLRLLDLILPDDICTRTGNSERFVKEFEVREKAFERKTSHVRKREHWSWL